MAAKRWTWTLNNPEPPEIEKLETSTEHYQYIIWLKEVGKEGTPHLQGYVEFKARLRLGGAKKILGDRVHLEPSIADAKTNINYCTKTLNTVDGTDDGFEWGTPMQQGHRSDLDAVRNEAANGGMRAVVAKYNSQQIRVAEKFLEYHEEMRDSPITVLWFHGDSGTGKSRTARQYMIDHNIDFYTKNDVSKWWTGYDGQEGVIIDDFRSSWWPLTEMLRILDRYECKLETKGGHRQLLATTIIVTSAFAPKNCYYGCGEAINQLVRRVTEIREFQ